MSQLASRRTALVTPVRSTSRAAKLAWIAVVLLLPVVWGYVAVLRLPSDGTAVYASSSLDEENRWSDEDGVVVTHVYGDST